jgi:MbtH protein
LEEEAAMNRDEHEDTTIYKVVINHEEQYSIWPADRENALGWRDADKTGTKAECLAYIKEVWTDMRPLSLRKKMEEMAASERAHRRHILSLNIQFTSQAPPRLIHVLLQTLQVQCSSVLERVDHTGRGWPPFGESCPESI